MSDTTTQATPTITDEAWLGRVQALRNRPPREAWRTIPDAEKVRAVEEARRAYANARRNAAATVQNPLGVPEEQVRSTIEDDPAVQAAREALDDARQAAVDAEVEFHFRSLPPHVYEAIKTGAFGEDGRLVERDFVVPLVSVSSVRPLPVDLVEGLFYGDDDNPPPFNGGDIAALAQACVELNETTGFMLGKGSGPTPG